MRKIVLLLLSIITISLSIPMVTLADDSALKIGDKLIWAGGYEATIVGFNRDGQPIYQADFSNPTYLPDLVTKIDTQWHYDSKTGSYYNGANSFESYVANEFVYVNDSTMKNIYWQPEVMVSQKVQSQLQAKATLLDVDPLNKNYVKNTLQWDLGNGIYRRIRLIENSQQEYYVITQPLSGDFNITSNVTENGVFANKPSAWDANGKIVKITEDANHNIFLSQTNIKGLTYPIIIDPDITFTSSASDGGISNTNAVYANARTAVSGTGIGTSGAQTNIGNSLSVNYSINRSFVYFDTSVLSGYVITAATLNLYCTSKVDIDSESIQIQSGMPTYPHDPLVLADYDLTNYVTDTNSGVKTIASFNVGAYNSIALDASGIAQINTTGITKFALRTTGDITNTVPTGENYVLFYTYEQGAGYRPKLVVTFTAITPAVVSLPASNVAGTTARLNGTVIDDGSLGVQTVQIRFGYGTNATLANGTGTATGAPKALLPNNAVNTVVITGAGTFTVTLPTGHTGVATSGTATLAGSPVALVAGANVIDSGATTGNITVTVTLSNFANYTTVTAWVDGYITSSNPLLDVSGLTNTTTYYYDVQVKNTIATVTAVTEQVFTTLTTVDDITSFLGYPASTSINLTWGKSSGSTNTLIRYRLDSFPLTTAEGTQAYFSTGATFNLTGLTAGTTYYFSAWGESGGTYSTNAKNLVMTTSSSTAVGGDIPQPNDPSGWFQTPNATLLVNLEPLYSIVNGLADGWGMPRGNAWLILSVIISFGIGLFLYIRFHAPALAMIVMALLMMFFVVLHIMPSFMIGIIILLALGSWGSRPSGV